MSFDINTLYPVMPEIVLLSAASIVLVIDLFLKQDQRILTYSLAQLGLFATLVSVIMVGGSHTDVVFDKSYIRDPMSDLLKIVIIIVSMGMLVYAKEFLKRRDLFKGEFITLSLFAMLGMLIMVSSNSFLTIYLGLELLALCMYALVAFDQESDNGPEAAMKYFVLGALASGILLYGISMIYGATGALDFAAVSQAVSAGNVDKIVLVFGLVFLVIGIAFKFGAVPFHMWVPDVYHGAPTAVTMFVGSVPKIAAFALAMRILVDGLGGLHADWQGMLVILAVLSMAIGNVIAIAQSNIKRMLAYSTISHVGFIFLGIIAGNNEGYIAAMFYTIVYSVMALGAFGMIAMMSNKGFEADQLDDLKGLNHRNPWFAGMMMLLMFSMAGVPPTVGFFAKLFVLDAVISINMTWLAIVAVAFSVIGAFYYIRIVKLMYFDKPENAEPFESGTDTKLVFSINGLSMLFLGLFPASLLSVCTAAIG
jgi:NADH-quinone oxidoreductase subunit N